MTSKNQIDQGTFTLRESFGTMNLPFLGPVTLCAEH